MPSRRSGRTGDIDWRDAVFGGACLGGVMWATFAALAMSASDHNSHAMNWTIVAAISIPFLVIGAALTRWAQRSGLRTAGVAAVIAPLTGPVVILGWFALGVIVG